MAKKNKTMNLNFGPQHPAAHGVLRLISDFLIVVVRPEFTVLSKSVTVVDIFYLSKLPSLLIFFCNCRIP